MIVTTGAVLVSVPVVVVTVIVSKTVKVAVALVVIVAMLRNEEQKGVAEVYDDKAFTTSVTARHCDGDSIISGLALTATPAAASRPVATCVRILTREF